MLFGWFDALFRGAAASVATVAVTIAFGDCVALGQNDVDRQTAGEKFKSISVLNDMPADQMGKVMNMMSAALGVNCGYCHEGTHFAKDDVGLKEEGRRMLSMTFELNRRFFDGKTVIQCNTCHRGQPRPDSELSLDPIALSKSQVSNGPPVHRDVMMPKPADVWSAYLDALGGKQKLEAVRSRHVIAKRIEPNGKSEPEELWQSMPNRSRMATQYASVTVLEGYDGNTAWKAAGANAIALKADESQQIRSEANLAFGSVASTYTDRLTYLRSDRILDKEVHVLGAVDADQAKEQLFFDKQSSLLVRRVASVPTVLGPFDYQVDYQQYRSYGGVLQPTRIRFAVPNISWTREVESIEINVEIDEALFRQP